MWKAGIRRIMVPGPAWAKKFMKPSLNKKAGRGDTYLSSQLLRKATRIAILADSSKNQDPVSKITKAIRTGCMAKGVQNLPTKLKALSSKLTTTKK
jgi:hypothetical protein